MTFKNHKIEFKVRYWIFIFNFFVLNRIKVEIKSPQFLGCSSKFYMLHQIGWIYFNTLMFKPDKKKGGKHSISFFNCKNIYSFIVRII